VISVCSVVKKHLLRVHQTWKHLIEEEDGREFRV